MKPRLAIFAALVVVVALAATACPKKHEVAAKPTPTDNTTVAPTEAPVETPTAIADDPAVSESEASTDETVIFQVVPSDGAETIPEGPTADFAMPVYEVPTAPDEKLAVYRIFWLGMNIEYWARITVGPKEDEATPVATAEAKKKKTPPPDYRVLPLIVSESGVQRFVNPNPADPAIDHVTFSFFRDRLMSIEVFYRTGYFSNVIFDDFMSKLKESYGDPASEEWKQKRVMGVYSWDDGTYSLILTVYSGRPFSLKFTHNELKKDQAAYVEELNRKASAKKVDGIGF